MQMVSISSQSGRLLFSTELTSLVNVNVGESECVQVHDVDTPPEDTRRNNDCSNRHNLCRCMMWIHLQKTLDEIMIVATDTTCVGA